MSQDGNPYCFFCYEKSQRHCAPNGTFDPNFVAASYLQMAANLAQNITELKSIDWTYSCLGDLIAESPDLAFQITLIMIDTLETPNQAVFIAAGPLEDLIASHGDSFIKTIETLARQSLRFRYVLSGVWPQGNENSSIWKRIAKLQATGPHMDKGSDLPPSDLPAP